MTKPLLLALALMLCGNPAIAVDNIGIYSDEAGVCCNLTILVSPPAYNSLYIIHEFNNDGSVASQFKVNDYSGLFAASQSSTFLTLGTWNTDLSVSYGGCLIGDIAVMTLNFLWFGTPITGCNNVLTVVAAPTSPIPGEIATVECDFQTATLAYGSAAYVDPTGNTCPSCTLDPCPPPTPTESRTWGSIKALYQ